MLPSDMTLIIRPGTDGYNNKIIVSDAKFSLGKNDEVNSLEAPAIKGHSNTAQGLTQAPTISHEDEKASIILLLTGGFTVWFLF